MKKVLALLLAIILLLPLAACSNSNSGTSGVPKAGSTVKLSAIMTGYGRYKDAFDVFIEKFAAYEKDKYNITVTVEIEYPQEKTVLQSRMATDETPDIFNMHVAIDAPLFDKGGLLPNLSDEPFAGKLYDGVRDMVTLGGKVVAVPMESFVWSCLYNKSHFRDLGLEFPNTLNDLKNAINAFNDAGITPFMAPFNNSSFCSWATQIPMCAIAAQLVPDFYDKMDAGETSFQTIADKGWLDIVDLIYANVSERALDITQEDGLARFAQGDGAMLVTGPWYSSSIKDVNPDFELGLGALPIDDNEKNSVVMLAISNVVTINPEGKNYEIAKDFLNFLLDDAATDELYTSCLFNQVATNQHIDAFPWTEDGLKYVAEGRVYGEHGMPSVVFTALNQGGQMYFDKQTDRAGLIKMLDEAYASGVEALN